MSTPPGRKVIHLPKVRMLSRGARQAQAAGGTNTGLKITHVKSIKPPDPDIIKKQEEDKLRAQLQKEIVSRSRSCGYRRYSCPLPVVSGRAYCAKHILSDPTAPYTRCAHERCTAPAKQGQHPTDHQLCFEHARVAMCARQRAAAPPPPVTTTETLLNQLKHYVQPEISRARTTSCASSVSVVSEPAPELEVAPLAVDPFKQIDATTVNANYSAAIMECASASDSEADSVTISAGDPGGDMSDAEDAPAEEMPLWRAGVYTAEEAVLSALSALRALQAAYTSQAARLQHRLHGARAPYLRALKHERELYCSINSQSLSGPLTVRERKQLRKLKAYASYRRKHGVLAVLARKLHHKRVKAGEPSSSARPLPSGVRCTFAEGGVRCAQHALPAAKHCLKHIIHDTQQVLFSPCDDSRGGVSCREPVARLPLPSAACRYHTDPPHYTVFTLKKDDSDSDSESVTSVDSQATRCDTDELPALPHLTRVAPQETIA